MDRSLFASFCAEVRERFAFLADHGWEEHEARWPLVEYRSQVMRFVIWLRPAPDDEHFFAVAAFDAVDGPDETPFFSLFDLYSRNHPDATNSDVDRVLGRRFFPANDREQMRLDYARRRR